MHSSNSGFAAGNQTEPAIRAPWLRSAPLRFSVAIIGASAITIGMFLGMSGIAEKFRERDPTQYFKITDFIRVEGRRKPRLAEPPRPQPGAPVTGYERADTSLRFDRPAVDEKAIADPNAIPRTPELPAAN